MHKDLKNVTSLKLISVFFFFFFTKSEFLLSDVAVFKNRIPQIYLNNTHCSHLACPHHKRAHPSSHVGLAEVKVGSERCN